MDEIIKNVRDGNVVQVRMWLDNTENDINQGDEHRFSLIHWAAREGKCALIELLVQRGARINVTNMGDDTPLHLAASQGHLEAVKLLITLGGNVNAVNEHGNTPLHYACFWNHVHVAKNLIRNGAFLRIQNKYLHTPLDKARIHMLDEYVDLTKSSSKDLMRLIPYKDSSQYGTKARSKDQNLTKSEGSLDPKLLKLSGRISSSHSGEVWKGSYRDVDIVVKLLKMRQCSERHSRDFMEEYMKLRICNHVNILPVIGVVNSPPKLCIVTYFQQFGSLFDIIHPEVASFTTEEPICVDRAQAMRFASDIAQGMQFLHSMENKLGNFRLSSKHIMIDEDIGKLYSPLADDQTDSENQNSIQLSAKLNMADYKFSFHEKNREYNPAWMSPESLNKADNEINLQASDMWSFGVILWELETHEIPFANMSAMEIGMKIATEGVKLPFDDKTIPTNMRRLINLCLQEDPGKRPKFDMLIPLLEKMKEKALSECVAEAS